MFGNILTDFERDYVPTRNYAASTLAAIETKLKKHHKDLGSKSIHTLGVKEISVYFNQFNGDTHNKNRALLIKVFLFAISKGIIEQSQNSPAATLEKKVAS